MEFYLFFYSILISFLIYTFYTFCYFIESSKKISSVLLEQQAPQKWCLSSHHSIYIFLEEWHFHTTVHLPILQGSSPFGDSTSFTSAKILISVQRFWRISVCDTLMLRSQYQRLIRKDNLEVGPCKHGNLSMTLFWRIQACFETDPENLFYCVSFFIFQLQFVQQNL